MRFRFSTSIVGLILTGFAVAGHSACDQIAPNPNPDGKTITNWSSNGCNKQTFTNDGTLNNIGTLSNSGKLTNEGTVNNVGTLNTGGSSKFINSQGGLVNNFGTIEGSLTNYGTVNNNIFGTLNQDAAVNYGTLNNNFGATLNVDARLDNRGTLNNNFGGQLDNTARINNSGKLDNQGSLRNDGVISNSGQFTNSASVTGKGAYTQTAGTTRIDGSLRQAAVRINGGVLQGTGTIEAPVVVNGGTIMAGNSIGKLTIDGDLSFNSGLLLTEIGGTLAGKFDVLNVTGVASFLQGTLAFSFLDGFLPQVGASWTFLTAAGGITGWENLGVSVTGLGGSGYRYFIAAQGSDKLALHVAAIPEPETYLLLLIGLALLVWAAQDRSRPRVLA